MNARELDTGINVDEIVGSPCDGAAAFIRENGLKLDALTRLLESITDETYAAPNDPASSASLGAHVRHVLDFYSCLARGAVSGLVDYEHRDRDPSIEIDREVALARIDSLRRQLLQLGGTDDQPIELLAIDLDGVERRVRTSLLRELEAALSHSVHHFAIIAVLLRLRGVEPPADFGIAPSTLRYMRRIGAER